MPGSNRRFFRVLEMRGQHPGDQPDRCFQKAPPPDQWVRFAQTSGGRGIRVRAPWRGVGRGLLGFERRGISSSGSIKW